MPDERVYFYRREGDEWIEEIILRDNLEAGQLTKLGTSVSLSGDFLVVGAPQEGIEGSVAAGAVYVFQRAGEQWNLVDKIFANDAVNSREFGSLVALSGNTLVVAAQSELNSDGTRGVVYVFSFSEALATSTDRPFATSPALDIQVYPTPFDRELNLSYEVPQPSRLTIDAYDMLGRKVATLEKGFKPAGTWQLTWADETLASGTYLLRIQTEGAVSSVPVIRR